MSKDSPDTIHIRQHYRGWVISFSSFRFISRQWRAEKEGHEALSSRTKISIKKLVDSEVSKT